MKPHDEWLFKAENDLDSAEYLLTSKKDLFDIVVYHAQQCAEKALKGFLAFKNQDIERTHSLIVLLKSCSSFHIEFNSLRDEIIFLNPFSTLYRYPMDSLMPGRIDAEKAVKYSKVVLDFTRKSMK